ncbi:MAG: transcriptional regulator [Alphaproteobacteria bacterium]|nr:transcriptional regulator [Alphaproteobacteria bacterium]HCP00758.1 transcriptional regulator [Rhodospirillaceae bacterium]
MFRLSRKTLFAIEAVLDIAYHTGTAPVQSREITRRQDIPRRSLEQVLQNLVRAGLLTGVRGPRGGYQLGRERRRITLADIVRVILEMEARDDPSETEDGSPLGIAIIRPMWQELADECMKQLEKITIQDLCDRARDAGVQSGEFERTDYTI